MSNKGKITLVNSDGKEVEFDVLFTFDAEETNKSYIVYTDNSVDEVGNIRVYASFSPRSSIRDYFDRIHSCKSILLISSRRF